MGLKLGLGVGLAALVVVACGGGVSLGESGQNLDGTKTADGGGPNKKDCSAPAACGPGLGIAAFECSDGSLGGNTGKCLETADGGCAWEYRECPADPTDAGACFDGAGELLGTLRTCKTTADCTIVAIDKDCCGQKRAVGVNVTSSANAKTCGDDRAKNVFEKQGCGCDSPWIVADDGTKVAVEGTPTVACSSAGRCETTFEVDPCAGESLPACPAECAQFPMTGACTAGDTCRLKGSKIGDECSCAGGTWSCAPHPPLGPGCNRVCN